MWPKFSNISKYALLNPESTKDNFYMPFKKLLEENLKLRNEERWQYIEAGIIKSKLCSLKVFTKFLINRSIFINLTRTDLIQVQIKISKLCSSWKNSIDQKFQVMAKFKSENLLTVWDFKCYVSSDHAKEINSTLKVAGENKLNSIRITK